MRNLAFGAFAAALVLITLPACEDNPLTPLHDAAPSDASVTNDASDADAADASVIADVAIVPGDADAKDAFDALDGAMITDAVDAHGTFVLPDCGNLGPFVAGLASDSQITGTWLNCQGSMFGGAGVPLDESGVVVRANQTWQKVAVVGGELVNLTRHTDYGTWTTYGGGITTMVMFNWDTTGLPTAPMFSADGRTMQVTTSAGGNMAILARVGSAP
jgi:hypothetical protein